MIFLILSPKTTIPRNNVTVYWFKRFLVRKKEMAIRLPYQSIKIGARSINGGKLFKIRQIY